MDTENFAEPALQYLLQQTAQECHPPEPRIGEITVAGHRLRLRLQTAAICSSAVTLASGVTLTLWR